MIAREFPPGPHVGGIGRGSFNIATALGDRGHDVVVVTPDLGFGVADGPFRVRTWSGISRSFFYKHRIGRRWQFAYRLAESEAALTAAEAEATTRGSFDVVDTWLWGAEAARFRSHRALGPLVVRLCTPEFETRSLHGWKQEPDFDLLDQRCLDAADIVGAISEENLALVRSRFRIDENKVVSTPLGVPVGLGDEPPPWSSRASNEILFVGRLEGRKGVEDLLAAMDCVLEAHPSARLTLVGSASGETDAGESFATHIERRLSPRVKASVTLMGRITDDELRSAYRRATVAVFPSRYESFGLVILEAMTHGTPVVATNVGGIPEAAGDAAILVAPRAPAELAAALIRLLGDSALRNGLANRGAIRVRRGFTTDDMVSTTLYAYEKAATLRSAARGHHVRIVA